MPWYVFESSHSALYEWIRVYIRVCIQAICCTGVLVWTGTPKHSSTGPKASVRSRDVISAEFTECAQETESVTEQHS